MATELEAFAGHLLVVGGRAVSAPPPGALAEAAPRRASRAREGDRFFILITPADNTHAPAALYEQLARLAADTYFGSSGGVTGGLREALNAVNNHLIAAAPGAQPPHVNVLAVALRGPELYAARSGRTFGALCQDGTLTMFPADRHDSLAMALPPLGARPTPDIDLAHYAVEPGQAMLLADAGLLDAGDDALRAALGAPDMRTALSHLKGCAAAQTSASVLQFVTPGTPDPEHLAAGARTSRSPVAPPGPGHVIPHGAHREPPPGPSSSPRNIDTAALGSAIADHARTVIDRATETATKVAEVSREHGPTAIEQASVTGRRTLRGSLRAVLTGLLSATRWVQHTSEKVLPGPDESGKQRIPTNLAISMAILIPVVIVIVVVGLTLSERGQTEFLAYLDRARQAHQTALDASGGNCNNKSLRPQWEEVLDLANEAAKFRSDDLTVLQIQADAQNYLDCFDSVQRHTVALLREFPDDADLRGPVVHLGVDLYTLDRANSNVYHDTLNETGDRLISSDDTPVLRSGQAVGSYVVGELFDIEWLRSGGTPHDNTLIALDTEGTLFSYSPAWGATSQQLVVDGRWQDPVAMTVYEENIYVLDPGADQIWKYVPPIGERRYSRAPEEYFAGTQPPDLTGAVDFGISADEGAVYVLFDDGAIRKFRRTTEDVVQEQPFEFNQKPEGAIGSGTALFIDNDPAARYLYIVDPAQQTIYETSWGGRFESGYRPRNDPYAFEDLSGIFADGVVSNNLYVVAGNRLYHLYRTEATAETP